MIPYYDHNGITIYQADCQEILPTLTGVDLIITSPPYNKGLRVDGSWVGRPTTSSKGNRFRNGYGQHNDALPLPTYEAWQQEILKRCWKTLSPNGAIFYNHKPRIMNGELWTPLRLNPGLPLRQIVIWATGAGINIMPGAYVPAHEWVLLFAKPAFRLRSRTASAAADLWTLRPVHSEAHPAPFPVALPRRILLTTRARLVVDPFMGTGSTLVAAQAAGVRAIGIELEARYCELAIQRLSQGSRSTAT